MPNLCDYKFIMIMHVILCLNESEIEKKREKEKKKKKNNRLKGSNVRIDFQFS